MAPNLDLDSGGQSEDIAAKKVAEMIQIFQKLKEENRRLKGRVEKLEFIIIDSHATITGTPSPSMPERKY